MNMPWHLNAPAQENTPKNLKEKLLEIRRTKWEGIMNDRDRYALEDLNAPARENLREKMHGLLKCPRQG